MRKIIILISALALIAGSQSAMAGTTGLGASPFSSGGQFTHTSANAMANAIDDNAGDIAELVTLSGKAADSTHLGTFTGSTIPDSSTIAAALQAIETAYESTLPVAEAYDATGWDGDTGAAQKNDIRDKIESLTFGGDIESVWDVTSGAATRLYQAAIVFGDGDATPDVSAGNIFITANTGATTITDFDTSLVNGQPIWIIVNDDLTTFDLTSSGLEGVGNRDYAATNGDLIMGIYSTVDSQWHLLFWPSSIGTASLQEGIVWADGDGTGSIAWAFATSAARTITVPGNADDTLATLAQNNAFTGNMTVAGTLQGRAVFNSYDAAQTLTQAVHNGSLVRLTVADEITLWDCTSSNIGSFVTLWARDDEKIEVVPASGDQFYLFNGTGIGADDELDIAATAGTKVCLMCTAENVWSVYSETAACTDGGAAD